MNILNSQLTQSHLPAPKFGKNPASKPKTFIKNTHSADTVLFSGRQRQQASGKRLNKWVAPLTALLVLAGSACASEAEKAVEKMVESCEGDQTCEIERYEEVIDDNTNTNQRRVAIDQYMQREDIPLSSKVQLLINFMSGEALESVSLEDTVKTEETVMDSARQLKNSLDPKIHQDLIDILNQLILNAPRDDKRFETYDIHVPAYNDCHSYGLWRDYCDYVDAHDETVTDTWIIRRYPLALEDALSALDQWLDDQALLDSLRDDSGQVISETVSR